MTLEELNQHLELREKLVKAQEILASLRDKAYPGAAKMTGMPRTPGVSDKVGSLAVEIADMETYITEMEAEIREKEAPVLQFIQSIDDVQLRMIFRLRFLRALSWGEVAFVVGGGNTEESVKKMCYRHLSEA